MFARMNTFEIQNINDEEGLRRIRALQETIYSAMQEQKGFKRLFMFGNPSIGKGHLISLWESEADLKAWLNSNALAQASARLREAYPDWPPPPPFEDYQVLYEA
jgi:heme-degrading monooxygenase HmoA